MFVERRRPEVRRWLDEQGLTVLYPDRFTVYDVRVRADNTFVFWVAEAVGEAARFILSFRRKQRPASSSLAQGS